MSSSTPLAVIGRSRSLLSPVQQSHTSNHFLNLPQHGKIQAEYVWLGNSNESGVDLRSKTRTLDFKPTRPEDLPDWNFDGSSTNQAPGADSEVIIKPRRIFKDPFRPGDNILVLCDCYKPNGDPLPSNTRHPANALFERAPQEEPWFGIEQEFTLFSADRWPLGWPKNGFPGPQGPYYCSAGAENSFGRQLIENHYRACLYAGIKISGINAEVMPGQWEFQVGPCVGIEMGDHLCMARYLMARCSEEFGYIVSYDPKPVPGDWNGAGGHCNYSTKSTRSDGGYKHILAQIEKLGKRHKQHIERYGTGNERRLTGKHETASIDDFSFGVANRGASIRIGRDVERNGKGYYEDRRPASNLDPYVVSSMIFETTVLWDGQGE